MKVVHLSTYHTFGGAAIAALRLHHGLRGIGVESSVLVQHTEREEDGVQGFASGFLAKKMAFARFAAERAYFLFHEKDKSVRFHFSPLWAGVDVSVHPLVRGADVIHLHWINFGFLSLHSLEKLFALGKPVVWTMHDMSTFTGGCHYSRECDHYLTHCGFCPCLRRPSTTDLASGVFDQKKKLFLNAPLTLVSPSRWLAALGARAALTQHLTSLAIPNPIDTSVFKPASSLEIDLNPAKKWILFAGVNTQDPRKGFAYFKEATQLLKDRVEQWGIVVFGKTDSAALTDMGLEVKSLGSLPAHEVVKVYQAVEVMVVPSLEDNYPNTVIEAMACGTPVVGFDSGGISEQIEHQKTGYVAELYSSEDLAKGIRFVLEEADYEQLTVNSVRVVRQRNSFGVVANEYLSLYQKLTKVPR